MTDRELMQKALEALERCVATCFDAYAHEQVMSRPEHFVNQNITALRERLAQPEQEPVAWGMRDMHGNIYDCISVQEHARIEGDYNVPLYTTPPRREWVGLTATEQMQVAIVCGCADVAWIDFACAIEAKLKEKNA